MLLREYAQLFIGQFREPLRHPVVHALQLLVLQRVILNAIPS